jgi:CheY-like chemotaxis protein
VTVSTAAPEGKVETVLLVEDEEAVRDVVERILVRDHYRVIAVASAQEALRAYAESDGCIDVLLTDMIMPGLSGAQLAERLRRNRPGLPALYMSGYTGDRSREHPVEGVEITVIQKPFAASALLTRLREVLTPTSSTR